MAKTKLPLVSLEARGAIGKAVVYFPWKGINAVREYVIPANPKTAAQQTQRGYMTDAVTDWHASEFTTLDADAWRLAATLIKKVLTGPNTFIRTHVLNSIAGKTWIKHSDFRIDLNAGGALELSVKSDDISTPLFFDIHWPIYYFYTAITGSYHAPSERWVGTISGQPSGRIYFFKTRQDGAASHGEIRWIKVIVA